MSSPLPTIQAGSLPGASAASSVPERHARIATALGLGGHNDEAKTENLALAVEKLRERIGVPGRLRDASVDEITLRAQVDELSERTFDDQRTDCNPQRG